jgi:hypothetical protein
MLQDSSSNQTSPNVLTNQTNQTFEGIAKQSVTSSSVHRWEYAELSTNYTHYGMQRLLVGLMRSPFPTIASLLHPNREKL